jgi:hypothetical protein
LKRDIAGLRNKIESAAYDVRSNLLEETMYKPYYSKEDKSKLEKFADEIDEWLRYVILKIIVFNFVIVVSLMK